MLSLDDFLMCMAPLARHWPEPTPEQWSDYRAILGHLDAPVLAAAVLQVLATHVYPTFPKPAVILAAAGEIAAPVLRSGQEAWGDVLRYFGARRERPGDPLVEKTVEAIGGWRVIGASDEGSMLWPFVKAYEAIRDREHADARELPAVADVRRQINGQREEMRQLTAGIGKGKGS